MEMTGIEDSGTSGANEVDRVERSACIAGGLDCDFDSDCGEENASAIGFTWIFYFFGSFPIRMDFESNADNTRESDEESGAAGMIAREESASERGREERKRKSLSAGLVL